MLKLEKITFNHAPRLPGVSQRDYSTIECSSPADALIGWRVSIRGSSVLFVTPPGWNPQRRPHEYDKTGPVMIFEVPRNNCVLQWSGGSIEDVDTIGKGKFDSVPFGKPPEAVAPPSILAQIDPKELGDR